MHLPSLVLSARICLEMYVILTEAKQAHKETVVLRKKNELF